MLPVRVAEIPYPGHDVATSEYALPSLMGRASEEGASAEHKPAMEQGSSCKGIDGSFKLALRGALQHLDEVHNFEMEQLYKQMMGVPNLPCPVSHPPPFHDRSLRSISAQPNDDDPADTPREMSLQQKPEMKAVVVDFAPLAGDGHCSDGTGASHSTIGDMTPVASRSFSPTATDTVVGRTSLASRPSTRHSIITDKRSSRQSVEEESLKMMAESTARRSIISGQGASGQRLSSRGSFEIDANATEARPLIAMKRKAQAWLLALIESVYFETFFAAAIITNIVFLGIRTDMYITNLEGSDHPLLDFIENMYTFMFTMELALRLGAEGVLVFLTPKKMLWYYLDLVIVVTSLVEWALAHSELGSLRMFRVIRVVRMMKIIRIARVLRFIRSLRRLVLSIVHTLRAVCWSIVLLGLIIYVFALTFVQAISEDLNQPSTPSLLSLYWGNLPRSMFTLYKSITAGINWGEVAAPLAEVNGLLVILFIVYISFTVFAVLNVITGVFCEAAIESANGDREMLIQQQMTDKEVFTSAMYEVFGIAHHQNEPDIILTYAEFEDVLSNGQTKAYLASIELDISDAWELFKLLDEDESSLIDVEEFVHGCLRLKGVAKAIDIAKLNYENRMRQKRMVNCMDGLEDRLVDLHMRLFPGVEPFVSCRPMLRYSCSVSSLVSSTQAARTRSKDTSGGQSIDPRTMIQSGIN